MPKKNVIFQPSFFGSKLAVKLRGCNCSTFFLLGTATKPTNENPPRPSPLPDLGFTTRSTRLTQSMGWTCFLLCLSGEGDSCVVCRFGREESSRVLRCFVWWCGFSRSRKKSVESFVSQIQASPKDSGSKKWRYCERTPYFRGVGVSLNYTSRIRIQLT